MLCFLPFLKRVIVFLKLQTHQQICIIVPDINILALKNRGIEVLLISDVLKRDRRILQTYSILEGIYAEQKQFKRTLFTALSIT